jgi:hypothetical protein
MSSLLTTAGNARTIRHFGYGKVAELSTVPLFVAGRFLDDAGPSWDYVRQLLRKPVYYEVDRSAPLSEGAAEHPANAK